MANIAIDLLPSEFRVEEVKKAKFLKVQTIGIGAILLVVFLSSLIIALRILQSQRIAKIQSNLTQLENRTTNLKDVQASIILLKNRLSSIAELLGISSTQAQMYKLVEGLVPPSVVISSISVSKDGHVLILAITSSSSSIDELINKLISKESNDGKVGSLSLESINRGKDGIYRINFKVSPKGK